MKSTINVVSLVIFAVTASLLQAVDDFGFKPIFNGKDLTGWHGNNPHQTVKAKGKKGGIKAAIEKQQEDFKAHWSVDNGELVNDGHGPYATTDKEYGDIEFHIDYKTVAKADSGIYLRGTPQVQIWDTTPEGARPARPAMQITARAACSTIPRARPGSFRWCMPIVLSANGTNSASPSSARGPRST